MKKKTKAVKPELIIPVLTKHTLAEKAEFLVHRDGIRYSEAIVQICDELEIEPADVASLVTGALLEKVEFEAMKFRVIPRKPGNTASLY